MLARNASVPMGYRLNSYSFSVSITRFARIAALPIVAAYIRSAIGTGISSSSRIILDVVALRYTNASGASYVSWVALSFTLLVLSLLG